MNKHLLTELAETLDDALGQIGTGKGDPFALIELVAVELRKLSDRESATSDRTAWVLRIDHRHGDDTSVHASERGAKAALLAYVDEYWDEEVDPDKHKPDDVDDRIATYFLMVQDEYYSIERTTLEPDPQEIITEAPEIDDACTDCNDDPDAPDCAICKTSNTGSREHPHLCENCEEPKP